MANVKYKRKELKDAEKRYTLIRDCIEGEITIKQRATVYLPMPIGEDDDAANSKRYDAYKKRATFYNVTKRTLDGLCGQIFMRAPMVQVPDKLDVVVKNADGGGVDLEHLAKRACDFVVGYGRAGLFVDYPAVEGGATLKQLADGDVRPTMTLYAPEKIINWRTTERGALTLLSLVVLEEDYVDSDDGFEAKMKTQWRVLRLTGTVYSVEIWRQTGDSKQGAFTRFSNAIPTDASGKTLDKIPFTFIGAKNNDDTIDEAPLYDIASLNVAHYRNSADYEESAFMVGQPTPVFSGLTEDWVKNVLKGKVMLGARGAISLPVGGAATLLQASPNSMPFEAMGHKEKQMIALGARLVEQNAVVRTASEATIDYTTESSILASAAKNVNTAFAQALRWCGAFIGVDEGAEIVFNLNTDFDIAKMSPEQRRQLIEEWQTGAISWEEVRANLRKSGIATMDDEKARAVIDEELASLPRMNTGTGGAPSDGNTN